MDFSRIRGLHAVYACMGAIVLAAGVILGSISFATAQGGGYFCVKGFDPVDIETNRSWDADECYNAGPGGERPANPPSSGGGQGGGEDGGNPLENLPIDQLTQALGGAGGAVHPGCVKEEARRAAQEPRIPPSPNPPFECVEPSPTGPRPGVCIVLECRSTEVGGEMPSIISDIIGGVAQSLLQQIMQGGQGGGSGSGAGGAQQYQSLGQDRQAYDYYNDYLQTGTSGEDDRISSILDGFGEGGSPDESPDTAGDALDAVFDDEEDDTSFPVDPDDDGTSNGDTTSSADTGASGQEDADSSSNDGFGAGTGSDNTVQRPGQQGVGEETPDEEDGGIVNRVCGSRVWAEGVIGRVVPTAFVEGICSSFGYQGTVPRAQQTLDQDQNTSAEPGTGIQPVAAPAEPSGRLSGPGLLCSSDVVRPGEEVLLEWSCGSGRLSGVAGFAAQSSSQTAAAISPQQTTTYGIRCSTGLEELCTVTVIDPEARIWAEPASVRLGSRTTIYWDTRDVESCTVSGPSFSEASGEGGATTVPISEQSTFSILCNTADGDTIEDSVTVGPSF